MASLKDFIGRLDRLAQSDWRRSVAVSVADTGLRLINDGFENETNPYGERWEPLKRPRPGKILHKTGTLQGSFIAPAIAPDRVVIVSTTDYGQYQQYGTRTITPRMMLPESRRGLGNWEKPIGEVVAGSMTAVLRG